MIKSTRIIAGQVKYLTLFKSSKKKMQMALECSTDSASLQVPYKHAVLKVIINEFCELSLHDSIVTIIKITADD